MFGHHGPGGAVTATGRRSDCRMCQRGPVGAARSEMADGRGWGVRTLEDGRRSSGGLMEMPFGLKGSEDTSTGGWNAVSPA